MEAKTASNGKNLYLVVSFAGAGLLGPTPCCPHAARVDIVIINSKIWVIVFMEFF
jgi:hypothetical protein